MHFQWEGLDHVQLTIPAEGLERGRQFYGGLLGLTEIAKPITLKHPGLWFRCGLQFVHLSVDGKFQPSTAVHAALRVSDLNALRAHLHQNRVMVDEAEPLVGLARCYVHDPFGNLLELIERTEVGSR